MVIYIKCQKWMMQMVCALKITRYIIKITKSGTVNWRQNPVLLILFHTGKTEAWRKSWKIEAYLQEILETFGQLTGSSTAVTPSLISQDLKHL